MITSFDTQKAHLVLVGRSSACFHVFENSIQIIFVYTMNRFTNFCLNFVYISRSLAVNSIFYVTPEKVVAGGKSGERAGHEIDPPLPIHRTGGFVSKYRLTSLA